MLGQNHSWTTGAVANMAFGRFGGVILAIPVMAGIFTGMNGFFMATTRLLLSMGRGKFLHPWFVKVHPKHGTPTNACLLYTSYSRVSPIQDKLNAKGIELDALSRNPNAKPETISKLANEVAELRSQLRAERMTLGDKMEKELGVQPGRGMMGNGMGYHNGGRHGGGCLLYTSRCV